MSTVAFVVASVSLPGTCSCSGFVGTIPPVAPVGWLRCGEIGKSLAACGTRRISRTRVCVSLVATRSDRSHPGTCQSVSQSVNETHSLFRQKARPIIAIEHAATVGTRYPSQSAPEGPDRPGVPAHTTVGSTVPHDPSAPQSPALRTVRRVRKTPILRTICNGTKASGN